MFKGLNTKELELNEKGSMPTMLDAIIQKNNYGVHQRIYAALGQYDIVTGVALITSQRTKFMGPTWGPPGSYRPQMGPMLATWTLLSGIYLIDAKSFPLSFHITTSHDIPCHQYLYLFPLHNGQHIHLMTNHRGGYGWCTWLSCLQRTNRPCRLFDKLHNTINSRHIAVIYNTIIIHTEH